MRPAATGNQFIKKYVLPNEPTLDYIRAGADYTFSIVEGPIRAGKTSDNITIFCMEIEKSPDPLHFTIGQTQSAAKAILWESEGLGIAHWPDWQARIHGGVHVRQRIFKGKYQGHDALILLPKYGSGHPIKYIVAFGGLNSDSHELYKGWSAGMFIATQWELLHTNTRSELLKRTALSSYRKHIIDLNPTSPHHEIYKDMERWADNTNYFKKLMQDNPVMTPERMEEIKSEYDPESVGYKRDILGERAAAEGLIYRVRDYNILDEYDIRDYASYITVADIGQSNSATVFVLMALSRDRRYLDVLHHYYHKNKDIEGLGVKMPIDYATDYQEFIRGCMTLMGMPPEAVLTDTDLTFMREFERTKYQAGLGGINLNSKFRKDEIHDRIKTGINMLYTGRLRFYNAPIIAEAFRVARYDEKKKQQGKYVRYDAPHEGTMIDPIDAVEYGMTYYRNEVSRWVSAVG